MAYSSEIKGVGVWSGAPNLCTLQPYACTYEPSGINIDQLVSDTRLLYNTIYLFKFLTDFDDYFSNDIFLFDNLQAS